MWICTKEGFFSIVAKDCAPDELLVRARRPQDINAVWPKARVEVSTRRGSDYRYRARIKRADIIAALSERIEAYDAANFKDSVRDDDLHDAYTRVWGVMGRLQPGGPYSHGDYPEDELVGCPA